MEKIYVGIDLGGTSIKGGVMTKEGQVLAKWQTPTQKEKGVDGVLLNVKKTIDYLLDKTGKTYKDVQKIGFGIPGIVDDNNIVVEASNLGWWNEDIGAKMSKLVNVPVILGNDANVAALGEVKFGVAKGLKSAFMLTLGTGLGSGIIIDGKIFAGNRGCGAEIGHVVLKKGGNLCNCGQRGCAETYLSATALKREGLALYDSEKSTALKNFARERVNAKVIFDLSQTDEECKKIVDNFIEDLYDLCINIANGLRPEAIIIGGGVSLAGDKIIAPLQKKLDQTIFAKELTPKVAILPASLGNDAGFMGAVSICL